MQYSRKRLALMLLGLTAATLRGQAALELGKSLQAVVAGGQSQEYKLQLRAGEYARVVVEQRNVDVSITCLAPDGSEIFSLDSSVIGDPETVELIADIAGLYRLRITPAPHSPGGEYEIALREIQPSTERHRTRIAAARAFAEAVNAGRPGTREGFRRAIGHAEEALSYWRAALDRSEEATALLTIGLLYIEIADRQNALRFTTEALTCGLARTLWYSARAAPRSGKKLRERA